MNLGLKAKFFLSLLVGMLVFNFVFLFNLVVSYVL